jgi:hypothetical protein
MPPAAMPVGSNHFAVEKLSLTPGRQGCPQRRDRFIKRGSQSQLRGGAIRLARHAVKLSGHDAQGSIHAETMKILDQGGVILGLDHQRTPQEYSVHRW